METKSKAENLASRLAQSKAVLQKKQLALQKATSTLAMLRRRRRTWYLIRCGTLFEQADLVDLSTEELSFDRDLVIGFLIAMKNNSLTAEEAQRYRAIGKMKEGKRLGQHRTDKPENRAD